MLIETDKEKVQAAARNLRKASMALSDVVRRTPNEVTAYETRQHMRDLWEWGEKLDKLSMRYI